MLQDIPYTEPYHMRTGGRGNKVARAWSWPLTSI